MNVTRVEVDDAMSVFSSVAGNCVAGRDWEADENGTAGALAAKACDALFDRATFNCGSWLPDS